MKVICFPAWANCCQWPNSDAKPSSRFWSTADSNFTSQKTLYVKFLSQTLIKWYNYSPFNFWNNSILLLAQCLSLFSAFFGEHLGVEGNPVRVLFVAFNLTCYNFVDVKINYIFLYCYFLINFWYGPALLVA